MQTELALYDSERMTVMEVAEALGVSEALVKKRALELGYDRSAVRNSQGGYLFNEAEVTAIKLRISQNPNIATSDDRRRLADMPRTDLEKELIIQQALTFQAEKIASLEAAMSELAPKADFYDRVTSADNCIDMAEAAQVLGIPGIGRNKLYNLLRGMGVLRPRSTSPYQEYVNRDYFRIIEIETPVGVKTKTLVTQKGLDYIRKVLD